MDKEKIIEILTTLNNLDLNDTDDASVQLFKKQLKWVDIAINQVQVLCKNIKKLNDNQNATLNMVCACLVNLWIASSNAARSSTETFKTNRLYIKTNTKLNLKNAKKLFDRWRSYAAPILIDDGFAFFTTKELHLT